MTDSSDKMEFTFEQLQAHYKRSSNSIKKDNVGNPDPVSIEKDYALLYDDNSRKMTMIVKYWDGNGERQTHVSLVE